LIPWYQSRLNAGIWSARIVLSVEGEQFELFIVVIDPLTLEAILRLDMLITCTVDLLHKRLITGVGHVIGLDCQTQNIRGTVGVNNGQQDSCVVFPSSEAVGTHSREI